MHAFAVVEEYGEEHPEYFALTKADRRGSAERLRGREKLCLSTPSDRRGYPGMEAAGKPEYWKPSAPNGGTPGFCHCEKCMARAPPSRRDFLAHLTTLPLVLEPGRGEGRNCAGMSAHSYCYSFTPSAPARKVEYPDNLTSAWSADVENNDEFSAPGAKAGAKNFPAPKWTVLQHPLKPRTGEAHLRYKFRRPTVSKSLAPTMRKLRGPHIDPRILYRRPHDADPPRSLTNGERVCSA